MPLRVTSLQNQRIKDAIKLRDRDGREAQTRIIIDGAREISRALDAGIDVIELFVCEDTLRPAGQAVVRQAEQAGVLITLTSRAVQSKLAFGERDEGLVAVATPPARALSDLRLAEKPFVAVLAEIEKPGNIGAVIRSADSAGVSAVIVADSMTDLFNPNVIRASVGTIFSLPTVSASREETLSWLREHGFRIYATRVGSSQLYADVDLTGSTAIVLGNEAQGLSSAWNAPDLMDIALPMLGRADSLNVSVTAGVLFYEAWRQRRTSQAS